MEQWEAMEFKGKMGKTYFFNKNRLQNSYLKAQGLIIFMLLILLYTPVLVSGLEFDNIISKPAETFDGKTLQDFSLLSKYEPIKIENWFGIGETLAEAYISKHTEVCNINCQSNIQIKLYNEGSLIDDARFYKVNNEEKTLIDLEYKIYIKTSETEENHSDYKSICSKTGKLFSNASGTYEETKCEDKLIGSHIIKTPVWNIYNIGDKVNSGVYEIKIEGKKKLGDNIDWQIKTNGIWTTDWAIWIQTTLSQGLTGYWKFDETSDGTNSEEAAFHLNNITFGGGHSRNISGIINYCDYNDATGTGVFADDLVVAGGNFSYSVWLNPSSLVADRWFLDLRSSRGYLVSADNDGIIKGYFDGATLLSGPPVVVGAWQHYVTVYNGTAHCWWVNGTFFNCLNGYVTPDTTETASSHFGEQYDGAGKYSGFIDELAFWNRTLNQTEIDFLYNGGSGLQYSTTDAAPPVINITYPLNTSYAISVSTLNYTATDDSPGVCWYTKDAGVTNSTPPISYGTNFSNIISNEGSNTWIVWCNDTLGNKAYKNVTFIVDTTFPTLTINLPSSNLRFGYINKSEELNWSITELSIDTIKYNYNGTNVTIIGASNSTNFTIIYYSGNNITLWVNDTAGNSNSTSRVWDYQLFILTENYTVNTLSGSLNQFKIEAKTNGSQVSLGYLHYNNTKVLGSITSNGNYYNITRSQAAPVISTAKNITFYWNLTLDDGTNNLLTSKNQSVIPLSINSTTACDNMYNLFNLTIKDEIKPGMILNGTSNLSSMKVDLDLYAYDRTTLVLEYFNLFNNINPAAICINNLLSGGEKYYYDVQIEYGAGNYSSEFYNIEKYALNSSSLGQNISLYDLDINNAQNFKLIAKDSSYLPIGNALIQIKRKYIENGTYYISEIPKTNGEGITSASLQLNDVIYDFNIYKNNTLINSFINVIAICQNPLITACEISFNDFQEGVDIPDYESGDDFNFTLTYNQTSKIVSSQFIIPSGNPAEVKLEVIREDTLGTAICDDTLTSASGILSCVVPNSFGNATVRARLYKDNVEQGYGNIKLDETSSGIFGVILILLSVIVLITLFGIGVSDNPIVTAVFLFVGVVLMFALNLIQNTGFLGATATILFLLIAVILIIIKAARRN